jgi:hypothetical protein
MSQEDEPDEFAGVVLNFITRNRIGTYGVEVCFSRLCLDTFLMYRCCYMLSSICM